MPEKKEPTLRELGAEIVEELLEQGDLLTAIDQWLHLSQAPEELRQRWSAGLKAYRQGAVYGRDPKSPKRRVWKPVKSLEKALELPKPRRRDWQRRNWIHPTLGETLAGYVRRRLRAEEEASPHLSQEACAERVAESANEVFQLLGAEKVTGRMVLQVREETPPEYRPKKTL